MDWIKSYVLSNLWSLVLAAVPISGIVFLVLQWAKRTFSGIDEKSPLVQRAYALAGSAVLASLATFFKVGPSPCPVTSETVGAVADCLASLPPEWVKGLLLAILGSAGSFLLHYGKNSEPKP